MFNVYFLRSWHVKCLYWYMIFAILIDFQQDLDYKHGKNLLHVCQIKNHWSYWFRVIIYTCRSNHNFVHQEINVFRFGYKNVFFSSFCLQMNLYVIIVWLNKLEIRKRICLICSSKWYITLHIDHHCWDEHA